MELKIVYSKSDKKFSRKPTKKEYEALELQTHKNDITDLRDHLCNGKSITTSVFKGLRRLSQNFMTQQIFGVDFDEKISLKEVDDILYDLGINYNFGHYTFSHKEETPRFRIFFVLDGEVRDANLAKDIGKAFYEIFDRKSDKNAIDVARIWLGTNKCSFEGDLFNTTPLSIILEVANLKIFSRDRNQPRNLLPIAEVCNINSAELNKPILYKYNKIQNCTESHSEISESDLNLANFKIEELFDCKIFKTFYDGLGAGTNNKLIHHELLGIASNLLMINGGAKLYKECINRNNNYSKEKLSIVNYLKRKRCAPMKFADFSPFQEDQINPFQCLTDLLKKKGKVKLINSKEQPEYISQTEAVKKLKDAYHNIIQSNTTKVYLMRVATGLGKTELIKNSEGIVIAFPDNALKCEQYETSSLPLDKKMLTPSIDSMFSAGLSKVIENLYGIGRNEKVVNLLEEISVHKDEEVGNLQVTKLDRQNARDYLLQLSATKAKETKGKTIFTTHARAIFTDYPHSTLVFDENPLQTLFNIDKVSVTDLSKLSKSEGGIIEIDEIVNQISNDVCYTTPIFKNLIARKDQIALTNCFDTNIFKFLESELYIKDGDYIHYLTNNFTRLPKDKKIIIADATAPTKLWKHLFGDRLEVIEISNVKFKGSIKQITTRSCSRTGLKGYHNQIATKVGSELCITFKDLKKYFNNPCEEMHFGRIRGSNLLAGKKFSVVGTPHHHNFLYRFLAKICGLNMEKFDMKYQKIQYKNKEFWFQTFEDSTLRQMHLELVEGEIVQAVDRARLIWNEQEITLYSNLPIDQASYHLI